jgi:hypothetical protein
VHEAHPAVQGRGRPLQPQRAGRNPRSRVPRRRALGVSAGRAQNDARTASPRRPPEGRRRLPLVGPAAPPQSRVGRNPRAFPTLGRRRHRRPRVHLVRPQARVRRAAGRSRPDRDCRASDRRGSRYCFDGRSELLMSRAIFHDPSACRFQTVTYFPLSEISPPDFACIVHA